MSAAREDEREWGERVSEREMVKVGLERCDRVRVERGRE